MQARLLLQWPTAFLFFLFYFIFNFCFGTILYLQKNCVVQYSHITVTQLFLMLTSYITVVHFSKQEKKLWIKLAKLLYFTSFSTNILFLFQDPPQNTMGHLVNQFSFLIEINFTEYKINHFKMSKSVAFSTVIMMYSHHFYLVPKHVHYSKIPYSSKQLFPMFPSPVSGNS